MKLAFSLLFTDDPLTSLFLFICSFCISVSVITGAFRFDPRLLNALFNIKSLTSMFSLKGLHLCLVPCVPVYMHQPWQMQSRPRPWTTGRGETFLMKEGNFPRYFGIQPFTFNRRNTWRLWKLTFLELLRLPSFPHLVFVGVWDCVWFLHY